MKYLNKYDTYFLYKLNGHFMFKILHVVSNLGHSITCVLNKFVSVWLVVSLKEYAKKKKSIWIQE